MGACDHGKEAGGAVDGAAGGRAEATSGEFTSQGAANTLWALAGVVAADGERQEGGVSEGQAAHAVMPRAAGKDGPPRPITHNPFDLKTPHPLRYHI